MIEIEYIEEYRNGKVSKNYYKIGVKPSMLSDGDEVNYHDSYFFSPSKLLELKEKLNNLEI